MEMGFNQNQAKEALEANSYDVQASINYLLSK